MLLDIPFMADWHKIGERKQSLTDRGNQRKNAKHIDYDYKVGDKVLLINEGVLCKAKSCPLQSKVHIRQRAIDYHNSSYQWKLSGFNVERTE
jgi:hypothetical protein